MQQETSCLLCLQTEDLTGDNKWNAEGHGLQDTRKGSLFQELPPVLQLHLKRFNFDYQTWTPYKVCSSSPCSSMILQPAAYGLHTARNSTPLTERATVYVCVAPVRSCG